MAASRPRFFGPVHLSFEQSGRRIRIDGRLLLPMAVVAALTVAWLCGTTAYFMFRDDVLGALLARQSEMQFAYEDRIAAMRSQIDRITSRQLVDQDGVEGRLSELISRQAQLEARNAMVLALAEQTAPAPAKVAQANPAAPPAPPRDPQAALSPKTPFSTVAKSPLPDSVSAFAPVEVKPRVEQELLPLRGSTGAAEPMPLTGKPSVQRSSALQPMPQGGSVAGTLGVLSARLGFVEQSQIAALSQMEQRARSHAQSLAAIVADLGLERERLEPISKPATQGGQGGPFVPVKVAAGSGPFESLVDSLQRALVERQRIQRVVAVLPVRKPLPGDPEVTSGFGVRMDPFNRNAAMHTGIDFRDDYGSAVRATAPGRVTVAEWTGGYGNMVEVDHGNGIATRYAHLSAIGVEPGQMVATGAVIGRLGSTGRSTGPHLHYETRIDGEPVDPVRYLRAATRLQKLQLALSGG
jgi:murein DD-endopeptidase MepM/ murein hydrolase activator NlpD